MKRVLALLCALGLMMSLCGCDLFTGNNDSSEPEEIPEVNKPAKPTQEEEDTSENDESQSEELEEEDVAVEEEEDVVEEDPVVPEEETSGTMDATSIRGTVSSDNVYENEAMGLRFNAPFYWTYYTDEQINELTGIAGDKVEWFQEALETQSSVYDMFVQNPLVGENVNINFINLGMTGYTNVSAEDYIEFTSLLIDAQLEAAGYTNIDYATGSVEIDGETFPSLGGTADFNGVTLHQCLMAVMLDSHMGVVTVTAMDEEGMENILSRFEVI